jgi:F420-dependent oxidoreductase-like protein
MRLGLVVGYSGAKLEIPMELVQEADKLGYYACWTSEAYGSDAITPLAWIGAHTKNIKLGTAIMQMPARTPAMTAMTAMSLDALSGGRMVVGVGLSGPQVVEGWHGVAYGKPLVKTREYVAILRKIFAREEALVHNGDHYTIPYKGEDATGLGKPLKSILHSRKDMPIYVASIGPKNVELTAEIADGWLPIFYSPERYPDYFKEQVDTGLAKAGKTIENFDIAPTVYVVMDDDLEMAYNQIKPMLALYIGGMGAKGKNFYHELATRYGFEAEANTIQDLYLGGNKIEATVAVPNELVDAVALVGSRDRIKDRLQLWKNSEVTTLNIQTFDINVVRAMAEML